MGCRPHYYWYFYDLLWKCSRQCPFLHRCYDCYNTPDVSFDYCHLTKDFSRRNVGGCWMGCCCLGTLDWNSCWLSMRKIQKAGSRSSRLWRWCGPWIYPHNDFHDCQSVCLLYHHYCLRSRSWHSYLLHSRRSHYWHHFILGILFSYQRYFLVCRWLPR